MSHTVGTTSTFSPAAPSIAVKGHSKSASPAPLDSSSNTPSAVSGSSSQVEKKRKRKKKVRKTSLEECLYSLV